MADRPIALITGASVGIGAELARQFAAGGYNLVLVARRLDELNRLATELQTAHGTQSWVYSYDLSQPDSVERLLRDIVKAGLSIEVLVNNAGIGAYGPFAETDPSRLQQLLQINILALTALQRALLPEMLRRNSGRILNVASTASFQPGPLMATYYASKAYVLSLSEAVAFELRKSKVTVTCLCPGPTATEFSQAATMNDSKLFDGPNVMTATEVARIGYAGTLRGNRVVIPGFRNRLGVNLGRLLPRWLVMKAVYGLQKRKNTAR
jgi:short-subunit dehydrogenase